MADDLDIVVRADGSKAVEELKKVSATAKATSKANDDYAKAMAAADKFAADAVTEQSMRIIKMRDAVRAASKDDRQISKIRQEGLLGEEQAAKAAAASFQRLVAARMELAAATRVSTQAVEEHTAAQLTDVQATSAVVRAAEGQQGIRAVERFIAMIPGAGAAMQTIFPLVGGAMFLQMLVRMGTELYDMEQKARHAAEEFQRGFGDMDQRLQASNDELALSNSKLDDQIAKLSGHPRNGLETSLLEAKVAADKLEESLSSDIRALDALLKEHDVTLFQGALAGVAATGSADKAIQQRESVFHDASQAAEDQYDAELVMAKDHHNKQLQEAKDNQQKTKAADDAYASAQLGAKNKYYEQQKKLALDFAEWSQQQAAKVKADSKPKAVGLTAVAGAIGGPAAGVIVGGLERSRSGDQTQLQKQYEAAERAARRFATRMELSEDNYTKTEQVKQLQAGKETAEAISKAAEAKLRAMEGELAAMKLQFGMTMTSEYNFWEVRKSQFAAGSEQYRQIVEKEASLAEEGARRAAETIKKFQEQQLRDEREGMNERMRAIEQADRAMREMAKDRYTADQERARASERMWLESTQGADRIREFNLAQSATAQVAAQQMQAMHQAEAQRQLTVLANDRGEAKKNPYLTEAEREKQLAAIDEQIERLHQSTELQALEDQKRIESTTLMGGMNDAIRDFMREATDAGAQMRQLFTQGLNSTNDAIVRYLTEPSSRTRGQHIFGQVGHDLSVQVASASLKGLEGNVMKMLGLGAPGKHDGSSEANAMWVKMKNAAGLGHSGLQTRTGFPGMPHLPGMPEYGDGGPLKDIWTGFHMPDVQPESGADSGTGLLAKVEGFFGKLFGHKSSAGGDDSGDNSASGKLLETLGLGNKADGHSASSPLYVRVVGSGGAGAGGFGSLLSGFGGGDSSGDSGGGGGFASLFGKMFGGGGDSSGGGDSGGGAGGGGFGSLLAGLTGRFAEGTDFAPGGMALVGEQGPEIVNLPRGSQVVPNKRLGDFGGGGSHTHHYHIDARGATDPAAVEAATHRAIDRRKGEIQAGAIAQMMDMQRRVPAGRR